MSSDNVETAQRVGLDGVDLVEALAAGNDALAEVFPPANPQVESVFIAQNPEVSLAYSGIDGLAEGWRDWLEPWSSYQLWLKEAIDAGGDDVVMLIHAEAQTARDGVVVQHDPGAIFTFRDGVTTRARFYINGGDALRAAGIDRGRPAAGH